MDLRKLNSLHYRLLRTIVGDWKQVVSRDKLDELGRVRPSTWAKYSTASTVIKIIRDGHPVRLKDHILEGVYINDRSQAIRFFDRSKYKQGRQAIGNRIKHIFEEIKKPITFRESNNSIRLLLKKEFGFPKCTYDSVQQVRPLDDGPLVLENQTASVEVLEVLDNKDAL